jgi:hypothetical protein
MIGSVMRAGLAVLIASPLAVCQAQTIRGTVREQASGTPLSGVLVTLIADGAAGTAAATALTGERGVFLLRAPQPGRYRLGAKRIGVRRYESEPLELAAGQDVERNVDLEALVFQLPTVTVHSNPLCVRREEQSGRVASLWEEARTALTATQVSLRDRLVRARVQRYVRDLNASNLRVETERTVRLTTGVVERPFVSLPGDALERDGYWRQLPNDSIAYYAPDAEVLLSAAFARAHCFGVTDGRGDRAGLTGMTFEPAERSETPDVQGTIWLDARTFELRLVEFRYSRLPLGGSNRNVGGEVHFSRLPSGAWIVDRWFIRMPRYSTRPVTRSSGIPGQRPTVEYRVAGFIEEGGRVAVDTDVPRPPSPPR